MATTKSILQILEGEEVSEPGLCGGGQMGDGMSQNVARFQIFLKKFFFFFFFFF